MLPFKEFTPKEVKGALSRSNNHKAPGFDLNTGRILKQLPRKAIVFLTVIYNCILRLAYYPITWKLTQIIMVNKTNELPNVATSYRPTSLLLLMFKVLARLLSRILVGAEMDSIVPTHQFGFWKTHSAVQLYHRIVKIINESLVKKNLCTVAFLDIEKAFDRV